MNRRFVFNRIETAGSLGDLGTLLPIAIAMVPADLQPTTGSVPVQPDQI